MVSTTFRQEEQDFLLQSHQDSNLHMGTINALLLNVKSSLLFCDQGDSSRNFIYSPRSLHTACLTEDNPPSPTNTPSPKPKSRAVEKRLPLLQSSDDDDKDPVTEVVMPVSLLELKRLYHECLDSGVPSPLDFVREVLVSVDDSCVGECLPLLLMTYAEVPQNENNRRLLELQIALRLALLSSSGHPSFCHVHYDLVCKRASSKKMRANIKKQTPQQVLERELLNIFSLLAIRCDSTVDFRSLVDELVTTTHAPHNLVNIIYDFFELRDSDDEEECESTVPKAAPKRLLVPDEPKIHVNDNSLIGQSVSLTASIRKNALVPDQKRKYVGSHFNTKLSNVSALFRQVTVPVQRRKARESGERPLKKPRTAPLSRNKQVVSETPAAKRYSQNSASTLSPMGPDSQNARLVAQEALAARRKR